MNTEVPYLPTFFFFFWFLLLLSMSYCRLFCDTVIGDVYTRSPARYIGRWRVAKEGFFLKKKKSKKEKEEIKMVCK